MKISAATARNAPAPHAPACDGAGPGQKRCAKGLNETPPDTRIPMLPPLIIPMPVDVAVLVPDKHISLIVCVWLEPQAGQVGACMTGQLVS